jgi:uncharacterized protein YneF (UPF0154 family)
MKKLAILWLGVSIAFLLVGVAGGFLLPRLNPESSKAIASAGMPGMALGPIAVSLYFSYRISKAFSRPSLLITLGCLAVGIALGVFISYASIGSMIMVGNQVKQGM